MISNEFCLSPMPRRLSAEAFKYSLPLNCVIMATAMNGFDSS